jgi:excisionase family DNA binding protein
MQEYYSITQVAKFCRVHRQTIYRWIKEGRLHTVKLPTGVARVMKEDLMAFLDQSDMPLPPELSSEAKRPKILIADDDLPFIKSLIVELQNFGIWTIDFAENGYDACAKAGALQPDILLLDLRMPKMSGLDVCLTLKGNKRTSSIKIIAITAYEEEITQELRKSGIEEIFYKPIDTMELVKFISQLLELEMINNLGT